MRKADIIQSIHEKTGVAKVDVLVILETYFIEVKKSVIEKEHVAINGFGTFDLKLRKPKKGRNFLENTPLNIPEQYVPIFRPSSAFKITELIMKGEN